MYPLICFVVSLVVNAVMLGVLIWNMQRTDLPTAPCT